MVRGLSLCLRCLLLVCALGLGTRPALGQGSCVVVVSLLPCSPNPQHNVTITIPNRVVQLSISPGTTALAVPTPADYNAGFVASNGPTVTVRANASWTLSISSGIANWSAVNTQSEPARTNKPATDLSWSTAAAGPFVDLSTTAGTFASGNRTAGTLLTVFYRTKYSWLLDTPGIYSLPVVFTIVAP